MIKEAPSPETVFSAFLEFISNDIVMAHNANFDVNFLYDSFIRYLGKPFTNDFVDSLRVARKAFPGEKHNRLKDICKRLGVEKQKKHRAIPDCEVGVECYFLMRKMIVDRHGEEGYKKLFSKFRKRSDDINTKDFVVTVDDIDDDNPLFGITVVFTGALTTMVRKDAMQEVVNRGGILGQSLTKSTDLLVVGETDMLASTKDGKTGKMKKAEAYILEGHDITVVSEGVFLDMLMWD